MKNIFNTYRPDGFHTVNAYLFTEDPITLIDFLKNAFSAIETYRLLRPDTDEIGNCILQIGDSSFMITQATGTFTEMRTSFYLFVNDVDQCFQRAIDHGATTVFDPADMDYGDRQGGIQDPAGNYWWISKRLIEKGYHE